MSTIDLTMMYAVHEAFQRDLERLTQFAGTTGYGDGDRETALACWRRFSGFLHVHHTAEDTHLWPVLRKKLAGDEAGLQVMERMEQEHAGLAAQLDAVDAALLAGAIPDPLEEHARQLQDVLTEHCRHEEEMALPLVSRLCTAAEWKAFGDEQRRQVGLRGAATFIPWLLDGASDQTRHKVLGLFPPPLRMVYRAVWRPRYMRGPRWQALTAA
jgi:hypothetical protein